MDSNSGIHGVIIIERFDIAEQRHLFLDMRQKAASRSSQRQHSDYVHDRELNGRRPRERGRQPGRPGRGRIIWVDKIESAAHLELPSASYWFVIVVINLLTG